MPSVNDVVRLSRWRWMGHNFRSEDELVQDIPEWRSWGSWGRGRPRETWLRTMQTEVEHEDWRELRKMSLEKSFWREFIEALCISWVPKDQLIA